MTHTTEPDLGPLTWVKSEIDQALAKAEEALGSATSSGEPITHIQFAQTHLHQACGALSIVGLDGLTQFANAVERLLGAIAREEQVGSSAEAIAICQRGLASIGNYLEDIVRGAPDQSLRLAELYASVETARGNEAPNPADLFYPDLSVRAPVRPTGAEIDERSWDYGLGRARAGFELGLLKWLKNPGKPEGATLMREAAREVQTLQASHTGTALWWAAQAFFDALAQGAMPANTLIRKLCTRFDRELRQHQRGLRTPPEGLLRETLYWLAHAPASSPLQQQVRKTWQLDSLMPSVGSKVTDIPLAPLLKNLHQEVLSAKRVWDEFSEGQAAALPRFESHVARLGELGQQLGRPAFERLTKGLSNFAAWLRKDPLRFDDALGLEAASALLLVEIALDRGVPESDFEKQVNDTVARLEALSRGEQLPAADDSATIDAARKLNEKQARAQVAREIISSLAQVEQALDDFFRNPEKRGPLAALAGPLHQIQGALTLVGDELAIEVVDKSAAMIAQLAAGESLDAATNETLAHDLSALGFYVQALQHGPADLLSFLDPEAAAAHREARGADAGASSPSPAASPAASEAESASRPEVPPTARTPADSLPAVAAAPAPVEAPPAESSAPPVESESPAQDEGIDEELLEIFLEEAREVLDTIADHIDAIRPEVADPEALTVVRRGFHTLKGSGRMVGLTELGEAAWGLEQTLNRWLQLDWPPNDALVGLVEAAHERFSEWVEQIAANGGLSKDVATLLAEAEHLRLVPPPEADAPVAPPAEMAVAAPEAPEPAESASPDADTPLPREEASPVDQDGEAEPVPALEATAPSEAAPQPVAEDDRLQVDEGDLGAEILLEDDIWASGDDPTLRITSLEGLPNDLQGEFGTDSAEDWAETTSDAKADEAPIEEQDSGAVFAEIEAAASPFLPETEPFDFGDLDLELEATPLEPDGSSDRESAGETLEHLDDLTTDLVDPGFAEDTPTPLEGFPEETPPAETQENVPEADESEGRILPTEQAPDGEAAPLPVVSDEASIEADEPVLELDEPAVELDEPAVELDEPAVELDEPAVELDEPVLELDEPALEPDDMLPLPATVSQSLRIGDIELSSGLYDLFRLEARDHIASLAAECDMLLRNPSRLPDESAQRAAHTLAGISGTARISAMHTLARALEHALERLIEKQSAPTVPEAYLLEQSVVTLESMLAEAENLSMPLQVTEIEEQLDAVGRNTAPDAFDAADDQAAFESELDMSDDNLVPLAPDAPSEAREHEPPPIIEAAAAPDVAPEPAAPVHDDLDEQLLPIFIEEGADLLAQLSTTLREWRTNPAQTESATATARLLHTLKGSARMTGAMRLGEHVHQLESRLESALKTGSDIESLLEELESGLDSAAQTVERLANPESECDEQLAAEVDADAIEAEMESGESGNALSATLRVRADTIDTFVNQAGEIGIARTRIDGELRTLRMSLLDLTENVIRLRNQLREVEIQAEMQMQTRIAQAESTHAEFDPLEMDRYTRLQELTRMMAESVGDVTTVQQNLLRNLDGAEMALHGQARMSRELQQALMQVRMVPFDSLADRLYRIVRQSAKDLGKRVNLDLRGGRIELDRSVLETMTAPLEHLLRNAVAHGIETPEQRLAAGKPPIGQITLTVRQEGNEIAISLADDGSGLDLERIAEKARAQGLLGEDEESDARRLTNLIFMPGFTTAVNVSAVSGRGVGMDVVKAETASVGGRIDVRSAAGDGTEFRIFLPLTLAATQALLVRIGASTYAIPSGMIAQVKELKQDALEQVISDGGVRWQEAFYPYTYMPWLLGDPAAQPEPHRFAWLLLLRAGGQTLAVQVDSLRGNQEVVVKNAGPQIVRIVGITGVTVLGDGEIVFIVNPVALASQQTVRGEAGASATATAPAPVEPAVTQKTVMVVDDSLTVRKITGRLLEREGYRVIAAKDGTDALEQLIETLPDVILSDIEMPRMDGFDLLRNLRADDRTSTVPVIMITSRLADKHREYAMSLGASHYLGKPYDEDELLGLIAALTGTAH